MNKVANHTGHRDGLGRYASPQCHCSCGWAAGTKSHLLFLVPLIVVSIELNAVIKPFTKSARKQNMSLAI